MKAATPSSPAAAARPPGLLVGHPNPPGRASIEYRLGDYGVWLESLTARLALLPGGSHDASATAGPPEEGRDQDFVLALLKAWAVVGDVLCFYQERIANEGYLRTATERLSIKEIVRAIGYELSPGLAARTSVAFTLLDARGAPAAVTVPTGAGLLTLPSPGSLPVTFETDEEIEARVEWNALPGEVLVRRRRFPTGADAREILLAGTRVQVRPGDPILLVARGDGGTAAHVRLAASVTSWPALGATCVRWEEPLPTIAGGAGEVDAFRFARRAALFGSAARLWSRVQEAVKWGIATPRGGVFASDDGGGTWKPPGPGMLSTDVRALVTDGAGRLFAGTPQGVFRSEDGGARWETASAGLLPRDVLSLAALPDGALAAGTVTGGVFRSADAGRSWEAVRALPAQGGGWRLLRRARGGNGQLPPGAVRVVAACQVRPPWLHPWERWGTALLAGTDHGVFRHLATGGRWEPWNHGLPNYDPKTGLAATGVLAILVDEGHNVYLGTKNGVFRRRSRLRWTHSNLNQEKFLARLTRKRAEWLRRLLRRPAPAAAHVLQDEHISALAQGRDAAGHTCLFAGGGKKLFRSDDHGVNWREIPLPPPARGVAIQALAVATGATIHADGPSLSPRLYVGTDHGLWVSPDLGENWIEDSVLASPPVLALVTDGTGAVWAGTADAGYVDTEWPGFAPAADHVDLDQLCPEVRPGSWIALVPAVPGAARAYPVRQAEAVPRDDFQLSGMVTRLGVPPDADHLPRFDLRQTRVYIQSESLALYEREEPVETPVWGGAVALAGAVPSLRSGRLVSISGERARARIVAPRGGVRRVDGDGFHFLGLAGHSVLTLLATKAPAPMLYAGTEQGVWVSPGDGSWTRLEGSLENLAVLRLDATGELWAGTAGGAFRYEYGKWIGRGLETRSVRALAFDGKQILCAGTSDGIFCWNGRGWEPRGLTGENVGALASGGSGDLWAGAARGAFCEVGGNWSVCGLQGKEVSHLCFDSHGDLYAVIAGGVRRWDGKDWQPSGLDTSGITALAADGKGTLHAAERGNSLWVFDGFAWNPTALGSANDVAVLTSGPTGEMLAGARDAVVLTSLDGLSQTDLRPDRFLSLPSRDDLRRGFSLGLLTPDLQNALKETGCSLSPKTRLLESPTGKAWVLVEPGQARVVTEDGGSLEIYADEPLTVLAITAGNPSPAAPSQHWTLRTAAGFVGTTDVLPGELLAFAGSGEDTAEVARVESVVVESGQGSTTVVLNHPLAGVYTPASLRLCANVADASHGETIAFELLGDGDAGQANQHFQLRKPPLTRVGADTESGGKNALTVRVRSRPRSVHPGYDVLSGKENLGVVWKEVPVLAGAPPSARVYTVRHDEKGVATLTFGDGINGARLPTGKENVTATYRSGLGADGNLEPDRVALFKNRLPGLRKVTNPVAASGGTEPEPPDTARRRAPDSVRVFGRIVSLTDYASFARSFAGVGMAFAQRVRAGSREVMALAVAAADGSPVPSDAPLLDDLGKAIRLHAARPFPLLVYSFRPLPFYLRLQIRVARSFSLEPVRRSVVVALEKAYGAGKLPPAYPLAQSEVLALVQSLPGIMSAQAEQFYSRGLPPGCAQKLAARTFVWDAQRCILHPPEGLQLNARPGPEVFATFV